MSEYGIAEHMSLLCGRKGVVTTSTFAENFLPSTTVPEKNDVLYKWLHTLVTH